LEIWAEQADGLVTCEKCGRFYKTKEKEAEHLCLDCRHSDPLYLLARSVVPYEGPVRDALHSFKFCGRRDLAAPFGELMASLAAFLFPVNSLAAVIPVPLHEKRLRERGFNQAALLSERVSRILKIPVCEEALLRSRETPSQTSLSREQRLANLRGAFEGGRGLTACEGAAVLLLDDVYTTGATVQECSRVLTACGVKDVYVVTLASGIMNAGRQDRPQKA